MTRLRDYTVALGLSLTYRQAATVAFVSTFVTVIGGVLLAMYFKRRNDRRIISSKYLLTDSANRSTNESPTGRQTMKIILHPAARTVEANGILVKLTRKEFQLMELLTVRGDIVSREQVFAYLYMGEEIPEVKILDVFICKIRGKLRRSGLNLIETVWGRGYKIAA